MKISKASQGDVRVLNQLCGVIFISFPDITNHFKHLLQKTMYVMNCSCKVPTLLFLTKIQKYINYYKTVIFVYDQMAVNDVLKFLDNISFVK